MQLLFDRVRFAEIPRLYSPPPLLQLGWMMFAAVVLLAMVLPMNAGPLSNGPIITYGISYTGTGPNLTAHGTGSITIGYLDSLGQTIGGNVDGFGLNLIFDSTGNPASATTFSYSLSDLSFEAVAANGSAAHPEFETFTVSSNDKSANFTLQYGNAASSTYPAFYFTAGTVSITPEPSTLALVAGTALLILGVRQALRRKSARLTAGVISLCGLGTLLAHPLAADTLTNFTIQNAVNYQQSGGTFDGQGSYSGTFTIDENQYANSGDALTAYDFLVSGPWSTSPLELTSSNSEVSLTREQCASEIAVCSVQIAVLQTYGTELNMIDNYFYFFVFEPESTFYGTTITSAYFSSNPGGHFVIDDSFDSIIIDPAAVPPSAPEPATRALTALAGLFLLSAGLLRRRPMRCVDRLVPPRIRPANVFGATPHRPLTCESSTSLCWHFPATYAQELSAKSQIENSKNVRRRRRGFLAASGWSRSRDYRSSE